MNSNTITTTARLTTLALSDGRAINLPAHVPGLEIDTATALTRALEYVTPDGIHAELEAHWRDAEAVGASPAQVVYHFVAWLAGAGDWAE
jgi:hypothetical protein